jgi:hypothetical protein
MYAGNAGPDSDGMLGPAMFDSRYVGTISLSEIKHGKAEWLVEVYKRRMERSDNRRKFGSSDSSVGRLLM